jgi:hypothetical protein
MKRLLRRIWLRWLDNWFMGDWFTVVQNVDGDMTWGIYHPYRRHEWCFGMTYPAAKAKADSLNKQIFKGTLQDY